MMEPLVDRDTGDECDQEHPATGLCEICREDAALPDEDFCAGCIAELEPWIEELVEGTA